MEIKERLFSSTIARQKNRLLPRVVKRKGKHTIQMLKAIGSPFTIGTKNHLSIRVRAELSPQVCQFPAQFREVIDLTIKNNSERPRRIVHGLMPGRRKINDGQSAVRQPHLAAF